MKSTCRTNVSILKCRLFQFYRVENEADRSYVDVVLHGILHRVLRREHQQIHEEHRVNVIAMLGNPHVVLRVQRLGSQVVPSFRHLGVVVQLWDVLQLSPNNRPAHRCDVRVYLEVGDCNVVTVVICIAK